MINIKLLCVGKIKEDYLKLAILEYSKRISKYANFEIIEVEDEKFPNNYSELEKQKVIDLEADKILAKLSKIKTYTLISLDLNGKEYSSTSFANRLSQIATYNSSTIVFIIGGSLGISNKILSISDELISFSKFTFPHQLIRLFFAEQIFRSFKILNNETYHH